MNLCLNKYTCTLRIEIVLLKSHGLLTQQEQQQYQPSMLKLTNE